MAWTGTLGLCLAAGCAPSEGSPAPDPPFPHPAALGQVDLTIAYDHVDYHPRLPKGPGLGLAILIESGGHSVLYDAGEDGARLISNLRLLGKDPRRIETVILSHLETGHWQGLPALLDANPEVGVLLPEQPSPEWLAQVGGRPRNARVVSKPELVAPGVATTGLFPGPENGRPGQGALVHTPLGLVLIVGCGNAHPVVMTRAAVRLTGEAPLMVVGGFVPMQSESDVEKTRKAAALHTLGPTYVALFHCACGDTVGAKCLEHAWGKHCLRVGNGARLQFRPGAAEPEAGFAPLVGLSASQPAVATPP